MTSGALGSTLAGYFFIIANESLLQYFFRKTKNKTKSWSDDLNWRGKIILSYIFSDFIKTTIFLPFEARKQRIQMSQNIGEIGPPKLFSCIMRAYFPLLLRDAIFRIITLGSFMNTLVVEHKPILKYDLGTIRDFIHIKEQKNEQVKVSYFVDYSKFVVYSPFKFVYFNLVLCTIIATLVTHPLDLIVTKMLTQTQPKYKNLIQSYNLIVKQEGVKKLFLSGFSVRLTFNILSAFCTFFLFETFESRLKSINE